MNLLKFITLLFVLTFLSSNVYAAQNCDEIKGNIVGKLFCKAKGNVGTESSSSETSNSTEEESTCWKIWKKPKWMKKKN